MPLVMGMLRSPRRKQSTPSRNGESGKIRRSRSTSRRSPISQFEIVDVIPGGPDGAAVQIAIGAQLGHGARHSGEILIERSDAALAPLKHGPEARHRPGAQNEG